MRIKDRLKEKEMNENLGWCIFEEVA